MDSVLSFYNRLDSFDWTYGVTPLSQWEHIAVASVGYLATIFALRYLTPAPMRFRWLQALHNLFLTLLSVAMFAGVLSEAFFALRVRETTFVCLGVLFDLTPRHALGCSAGTPCSTCIVILRISLVMEKLNFGFGSFICRRYASSLSLSAAQRLTVV